MILIILLLDVTLLAIVPKISIERPRSGKRELRTRDERTREIRGSLNIFANMRDTDKECDV